MKMMWYIGLFPFPFLQAQPDKLIQILPMKTRFWAA